jgi:hypothetical protein
MPTVMIKPCGCELRWPARFCVLHAAAPALLAALVGLLAYHDMPQDETEYQEAVRNAYAAIAKAKEGLP